MMEVTSDSSDIPLLPEESSGSSVSTTLQEEYDELLKYAVVVPTYKTSQLPQSLADLRVSFPTLAEQQRLQQGQPEDEGTSTEEAETSVEDVESLPGGTATSGGQFAQSTPMEHTPVTRSTRSSQPIQMTASEVVSKLFSVGGERSQSPASTIGDEDSSSGSVWTYSLTLDQDVSKMENVLDHWTAELKKNVLAEFGESKIKLIERHKHQAHKEKERQAAKYNQQQNEVESLKELLLTYEQSIERKDQVISNLTRTLQKQQDRFEMLKTFCDWKIKHNDLKREAFASNLAERHYQRNLSQKVWNAWHSVVEEKWRHRVEKACQAKAQEVCMQLTNDYETKVASLNEALEAARVDVNRLHAEREKYEETMKKAFMRGVCALNMEAMTMFHEEQESESGDSAADGGHGPGQGHGEMPFSQQQDFMPYGATTMSQEPVYSSEPPGAPPPRVVTSQAASRLHSVNTVTQARSTGSSRGGRVSGRGKTLSTRLSARTDTVSSTSSQSLGGGVGLTPPMSSVMVERHPAISKQTIGHAMASRYPRPGQQPSIVQRKIAGQSGQIPLAVPNIETVKVVD